jgi:NAD(P)-dependent dehydrogenase (short-subunit alcohol dehydrogenase family)
MSVLDVNLTGSIYTARLAQYYLMKNKFSDSNAIVFMGSMGERPLAPV